MDIFFRFSSLLFITFFVFNFVNAAYTTDGLIASYNMDEGSGTTVADSVNANNGTTSGSPTWVSGGVTFDGTDDKIIVPDSNNLDAASFSYEVWFTTPNGANWATASTFPRLFDKLGSGNASGFNISLDRTTRNIQVTFASSTWSSVTEGYSSGAVLLSASGTTEYSKTYHVVFTFDNATKAGILYVNGDVVASGITSKSYVSNSTNLYVGSNTTNNTRNFKGTMHRVSIYNKALSEVEVLANNSSGRGYNYGASADSGNDIDSTNSDISGTGTTTESVGVQSSEVIVTVRDDENNPVEGKTVTVKSSRGTIDYVTVNSGVTDENGQAFFTVTSSQSGVSEITAYADGIKLSETHEITFSGVYTTETDVSYTSTLDSLSMNMDIAYNNSLDSAPVVLILHGHNSVISGNDVIQRLAKKGVFAIQTYKRGFGGSSGSSDDSGREVYDFIDAIEYVKENYSEYIDENNINVAGYSGGGGNVYALITKFPDYFRSANVFFGMSDYGFDGTYGWYNNGSSGSQQTLMQTRIGNVVTDSDNYYARAHHLAAKNNPYTNIQLFYDTAETNVPVSHAQQYKDKSDEESFDNVTIRLSDQNTTTYEIEDDFDSDLSDYSIITDENSSFTYNGSGYIDWEHNNNDNFNIIYKPFESLRNYTKTDRLVANFNFSISSTTLNATTTSAATVMFGFKNSSNFELKNSVALLVSGTSAFVRLDYDGIALDTGNRTLTAFTTPIATSTTYGFSLDLGNSMATATLKDSIGNVLETKTVTFASNSFSGVDSFGIYHFNFLNSNPSFISGTFDNLSVYSYSRWIHGYPQEGSGTPEGNITAENYFVTDIVNETWEAPVLEENDSMFIPGYVKTKEFQIILNDGTDSVANLDYDISGDALSTSTAKSFIVEGITEDPDIELTVYNLSSSSNYIVIDVNLTDTSTTSSTVATDSDGTLVFSGVLGSTHQYLIYKIEDEEEGPGPTPVSTSVATVITEVAKENPKEVKETIKNGCLPGGVFDIYTGKKCEKINQNNNFKFNKNLKFGDTDDDVLLLQKYLNNIGYTVSLSGAGSIGNETRFFGNATRSALIKLQKDNNISPAIGYFGPLTRSFINK